MATMSWVVSLLTLARKTMPKDPWPKTFRSTASVSIKPRSSDALAGRET